MTFSILFTEPGWSEPSAAPVYFKDVNLDQVIDAVTSGKDEYDLKPFFFEPLTSGPAVEYRHRVFQDLESPPLLARMRDFGGRMAAIRAHHVQAEKIRYVHESDAWFLEAIGMYCEAVLMLKSDLEALGVASPGFCSLLDYLREYVTSSRFRTLADEAQRTRTELATLRYAVLIRDDGFAVRKYESEPDYSAVVAATFEKFQQGAPEDYRAKLSRPYPEMNHIEAQILAFVARLYPGEFAHLRTFCVQSRDYLDPVIARFDREIQFYISYLEYIQRLRASGLTFCYPKMTGSDAEMYCKDFFDVALARKLVDEGSRVVCNDFHLSTRERIIVVTGPNQGGKTTFARAFGQGLHFAALGCLVPGSDAQYLLFDAMLTHFEREENIENLRGKLEDDLHRLRGIIDAATPSSIVILNEIFTSTTIADALFLSKKIMAHLLERDVHGVWVTFIDELASFNEETVSMVSCIVPENPAQRTFKIVRRRADGLAYATAIAEKHRVTYQSLQSRLPS